MTLRERWISAEAFWEIAHHPDYEGKRLTLIEGVIDEMPPAGGEHGDLASELNMLLRLFVKQHPPGRVTAAETGFIVHSDSQTGKDTVLAPDVGVILGEKAIPPLPKKHVPFAPDVAVEIISPSDSYSKVARKAALYLRYGTRLVIVVDPSMRTLDIYRAAADGGMHVQQLGEDDILDASDVLPGFRLSVRALFAAVA